jgi:hypothetical protein
VIAALFVQKGGAYYGIPEVDPWDVERDARLYPGPWPVVAHPPCERWSTLAHIHKHKPGKEIGDDGGCFLSALQSVRKFGGVLEHPRGSAAWLRYRIRSPNGSGRWIRADTCGGWVCQVDQGHYGHPARKPTWLYANGVDLPAVIPGPSQAATTVELMPSNGKRNITPPGFRDLLLSIARTARREAA